MVEDSWLSWGSSLPGISQCVGSPWCCAPASSSSASQLLPVSWLSKPLQASMGELSVSLCSTKVAGLSHVEQAWTEGWVVLWMCSVERLLRFTEGREFQHLLLHVLAGIRPCSCFLGLGCLQLGGWKLFAWTSTNVISLLRHGSTVSTRPIRRPCLPGQKKPASTWCRSMGRGDMVAPLQVCEKTISAPWCPGSLAHRVLGGHGGEMGLTHVHHVAVCLQVGWATPRRLAQRCSSGGCRRICTRTR